MRRERRCWGVGGNNGVTWGGRGGGERGRFETFEVTGKICFAQNASNLHQNLDASKIKLEQSVLEKISALNINRRYNDPGIFCEDAFNTFFPIYD